MTFKYLDYVHAPALSLHNSSTLPSCVKILRHSPGKWRHVFALDLNTPLSTSRGQNLDVAVDDEKGERNRKELRLVVDEFREGLARYVGSNLKCDNLTRISGRLRKDTRAALLASKRAIDATASSNRDELLQSSAVRETQDLNEKVA